MSIGVGRSAWVRRNVCYGLLFLMLSFTASSAAATNGAGPLTPGATPLGADADHEVVVVPDCDVAVRYPKHSSPYTVPVRLYVNTRQEQYYFHAHPRRSLQIYEDRSAIRMRDDGGPAKIGMECFDPRGAAGTGRAWLSPRLVGRRIVTQHQRDSASFCQAGGVGAATCGQIRAYSEFNLTDPENAPHSADILVWVWRTRDLVYIVASKNNPKRIAVQIQLNALAPSVPSVNFDDPQYRLYFQ